jgi:undecaprenyl-diphosphatase
MTLYDTFSAALLGLLEGLTEFIPVSSTGHLILLEDLIGFKGPPGNVFDIVIQLGAILAICVVYFNRLWRVLVTAPVSSGARRFIAAVLLAFLPAAVIGAFAHRFIKEVLFSPWVVAVSLILGGIAILLIERLPHRRLYDSVESIPLPRALAVGFCQCLAMVPGVGRAGATIMGALLLGVERRTAAEFSFFLAIPTMFGASVYDLYKNRATLDMSGAGLIAIGFVVAFIAAFPVVRWLVDYVGRHGFGVFAWYRIGIGALALLLLFLR